MTDYYVQVWKGGAWHRWDGWKMYTHCGSTVPGYKPKFKPWNYGPDNPPWAAKSTKPQQPLCKRCERSRR